MKTKKVSSRNYQVHSCKYQVLGGIIYALLTLQTFNSFSQGAALNSTGSTAAPSAILDVSSTHLGVLIPRILLSSTTDRVTISAPANKLIVYNTNASMSNGNGAGIYIYDSIGPTTGKWIYLTAPSNGPGTNGQVLTSGGAGTSSTWTTPNTGTVTNVTGTSPISVATGTTTPAISITSPLPIANGGTNTSTATPTQGGVAYGTGTAYGFSAAGISQQVLVSNGTSVPGWTNTITNLTAPVNPSDAATKSYVDAAGGNCTTCITELSANQCSTVCTWAACRDKCIALAPAGTWRMPTWDEATRYGSGAFTGTIPGGWITNYVWTSTPWDSRVADTSLTGRWVVFYESSGGWYTDDYTVTHGCRCVR